MDAPELVNSYLLFVPLNEILLYCITNNAMPKLFQYTSDSP